MIKCINYRYLRNGRGAESPIRGTNPGFQCCGTASTLEKAKEIIFNSDTPIDLILLDIYSAKENGPGFTACPA